MIDKFYDTINACKGHIDRYNELKELTEAPEIIAHNDYWRKLVREEERLQRVVEASNKLALTIEEYKALELSRSVRLDEEMKGLIDNELTELRARAEREEKLLVELLREEELSHGTSVITLTSDGKGACLISAMLSAYKNAHFQF